MTDRTKYVAVIVGGTPEEPWDVEREYCTDQPNGIVVAADLAQSDAYELGDNARVTAVEEVL